ncbi:hypothetical protein [Saccharospirillum salsuginis]|uniref:Uncharacterized protein n=1 Tax=Saccharospirillum salsuginis TaxID=418750 RepID=A0A918K4A3_9GAMM|nr:hypothetical protein [Saccharospirillum salsuginis]GGX48362.1 hypothetical protein GCM10007392_14170 [Saccharospirillum salsuginis]
MLMRLQHRVLKLFHPLRFLTWPLLILGTLSFPAMIAVAVAFPDLRGDQLFTGWVAGLGLLLMGILLAISRPEGPSNEGLGNKLRLFWETLVFWAWLVCLVAFLSLAVKIITFSG